MKLPKHLFVFFLCLCGARAATAQTADEIVTKYIAAIGGKEAWKKVSSLKLEAVIDENGTEVHATDYIIHNKGFRETISFSGLSGYRIVTPTEGWVFYPWADQLKPEATTAEELKESQSQLDIQGPLLDYKGKGNTIEYVGTDDFEGTDCLKLKLTQKSGVVTTYYIDPSNYLIIHSVTITKANGREQESKTDYSNYQKLPEGIWIAMTLGSGDSPYKIKKVEINPQLDDALFKPGK